MTEEDEVTLQFEFQAEWAQWLDKHHADAAAIWLRHAKKGAPKPTLSHAEALEVALCFGWIDSKRKSQDEHYYLQRWNRRGQKSIWSKVNRDKALTYIQTGHMQPSGLAEVQRAQNDGRWAAAYDPGSKAEVPPDLKDALNARPGAAQFFASLNSQNRYAVLFRIQTAKKPETRAKRIAQFAAMLARGETIYPQGPAKK